MSKRIVAISDTHCGHFVGLTPPLWWVDLERLPAIGELQRAMWRWYEDRMKMLQPIDALLHLGDAIDGKGARSGATELLTADLMEQCEMATYCIKTAQAKKVVMVYGTPYHVNGSDGTDYENLIAQEVGATIGGHEWAVGSGVTFDCKHKIGSSQIPHGRFTAVAREILWAHIWEQYGLGHKPDILLRGHVHYFGGAEGAHVKDGQFKVWKGYTMPALQGPGSTYGVRQCSGTVDVGLIEIIIEDNGEFQCKPHLMNLSVAKPEPIQLW